MQPTAPAANPTSLNSNQPYGGFGQALTDYSTASNILNFLPTQESQTTATATNANSNPGTILPDIHVNAPSFTSPTAQTINPTKFNGNLTAYNEATQRAMNSLLGSENTTYSQAQDVLSQAEQKYGNLTPVYQELANKYNIPGYQGDIATLSNLLQNLNRDVNAQTTLGGGAITQSARDEMYANEAQPLNTAMNNASEFLNFGQQDTANLLDTYQKSLTNALTPIETNIANLPGQFERTNTAAQTGYGQGQQTIEDVIQNQQRQQEIRAEQIQAASSQEQAATAARALKLEYGTGAANAIGGIASKPSSLQGINFKNTGAGGAGGYDFTVNGKAASAAQWAAANAANMFGSQVNIPTAIALSLNGMAAGGDRNAAAALAKINDNGGTISQSIMNQYPALFWGFGANTGGAVNMNLVGNLGGGGSGVGLQS